MPSPWKPQNPRFVLNRGHRTCRLWRISVVTTIFGDKFKLCSSSRISENSFGTFLNIFEIATKPKVNRTIYNHERWAGLLSAAMLDRASFGPNKQFRQSSKAVKSWTLCANIYDGWLLHKPLLAGNDRAPRQSFVWTRFFTRYKPAFENQSEDGQRHAGPPRISFFAERGRFLHPLKNKNRPFISYKQAKTIQASKRHANAGR